MGLFGFFGKFFSKLTGNGKDRSLKCIQCGKSFVFEAGEQEFFQEKGFQEPKRCPRCRKQHRFGGRFRRRR